MGNAAHESVRLENKNYNCKLESTGKQQTSLKTLGMLTTCLFTRKPELYLSFVSILEYYGMASKVLLYGREGKLLPDL